MCSPVRPVPCSPPRHVAVRGAPLRHQGRDPARPAHGGGEPGSELFFPARRRGHLRPDPAGRRRHRVLGLGGRGQGRPGIRPVLDQDRPGHLPCGGGVGQGRGTAPGRRSPPPATAGSREAARKAQVRATKLGLSRKLLYDWHETPHVLERSWNSSVWHRKAEKCLACGSCNIVCPTCYCFDIREEVDESLKTGRRFREWDGCMLSGFALVAAGTTSGPRPRNGTGTATCARANTSSTR
jgi:ferredoxin